MKQKEYMEYRPLGEEIERIRKGKNIPLRVLDENGVSSRTYQRIVAGDSDIRISDLAIIVEILSISPMEMAETLTPLSKTMIAKKQFNQAIFNQKFEKSNAILVDFREYCEKTSFTLGKQDVFYSMLAMEYMFNPKTTVTKEEILPLETQILERLKDAEVYTVFNLKFLALQKNLGLQPTPTSLFLRMIRSINQKEIVDIHSQEVIEKAMIDFFIGSINEGKRSNIFIMIETFKVYSIRPSNWWMVIWKNIAHEVEEFFTKDSSNLEDYQQFKKELLETFAKFLPEEQHNLLALNLETIEKGLIKIASNE